MGRAIAHRFAKDEGAQLLLADISSAGLDAVKGELSGTGAHVTTVVGDLSRPETADIVMSEAGARFGGIDALISNAGIVAAAKGLADLSIEAYELDMAVNARATWLLGKAAYPMLCESRGSIIATASLAAEQMAPFLGAYSASKAAVVMLVKQMAFEWGRDGIRCNCVSPGRILTAMNQQVVKEAASTTEDKLALRRAGDPSEIAEVVAFLASPAASYISGTNVIVDGGMEVSLMAALRNEKPVS